jgi:hypothetical protein
MTSNADLLAAVVSGSQHIGPVTRAMNAWDGTLTPEAVARVHEVEMNDITGSRASGEGRLRGSLLGSPCDRQQTLSYLGYEGDPPTQAGLDMMNDGTQRHYWWQKVGLSAGFLREIEYEVTNEGLLLGVHLDGLGTDEEGDYGFELKSTNPTKYAQHKADDGIMPAEYTAVQKSGKVLTKHALQIGGAFAAMPDLQRFSVVYEKRDYRVDWFEVVVHRDDVIDATEAMFDRVLGHIDRKELPAPLADYPSNNQCTTWCDYDAFCPTAIWLD